MLVTTLTLVDCRRREANNGPRHHHGSLRADRPGDCPWRQIRGPMIRALFKDAGMDDATIETLRPKWDALYDDVRRAAGLD